MEMEAYTWRGLALPNERLKGPISKDVSIAGWTEVFAAFLDRRTTPTPAAP
jgi:hypothetical protein